MTIKSICRLLAAVGAVPLLVLSQNPASAQTVDFASIALPPNLAAGVAGNVGSPTFIDPGTGVQVNGLYSTDGGLTWSPGNLYRRNQTNDHGLGVCNDVEAGGIFPAADCQ